MSGRTGVVSTTTGITGEVSTTRGITGVIAVTGTAGATIITVAGVHGAIGITGAGIEELPTQAAATLRFRKRMGTETSPSSAFTSAADPSGLYGAALA